jgi:hypothetical protein
VIDLEPGDLSLFVLERRSGLSELAASMMVTIPSVTGVAKSGFEVTHIPSSDLCLLK